MNLYDFNQKTALVHAVQKGHVDCVSLLIAANIDVNSANKFGESVLFTAASFGNVNSLAVLCDAGADVNIANNVSNTPLTFAAIYGHVECIREIVSLGADVNVRNTDMQTPLMMTSAKRNILRVGKSGRKAYLKKSKLNVGCGRVLLELGADVNIQDHWRRTPLYCALIHKDLEYANLMLKANANIHLCDPIQIRFDWFDWGQRESIDEEGWQILFAAGRADTHLRTSNFEKQFDDEFWRLKCMCRKSIRQILIANNPRSNLFYLVDQLPLPTSLRSMLVYYML